MHRSALQVSNLFLLIRAHQNRLCQNMSLHRFFELCPRWFIQLLQNRIKRIQAMKIPVAADRRTRHSISDFPPVINSLFSTLRQLMRLNVFRQAFCVLHNVIYA